MKILNRWCTLVMNTSQPSLRSINISMVHFGNRSSETFHWFPPVFSPPSLAGMRVSPFSYFQCFSLITRQCPADLAAEMCLIKNVYPSCSWNEAYWTLFAPFTEVSSSLLKHLGKVVPLAAVHICWRGPGLCRCPSCSATKMLYVSMKIRCFCWNCWSACNERLLHSTQRMCKGHRICTLCILHVRFCPQV